jgi:predicted O-methyltransferase YrrM
MKFTTDWFTHNIPNFELCTKTAPDNMDYLEIGCFEGRATCWMLQNALADNGSITCVDPYAPESHLWKLFNTNPLANIKENTEEVAKPDQYVRLIKQPSSYGLAELICEEMQFDFIYVDGDHRPHMALMDGCMAWGLLKQGGTMLFDDYLYPEKPTKDGIDAFLKGYEGLYEIIVNNYQLGIKKL